MTMTLSKGKDNPCYHLHATVSAGTRILMDLALTLGCITQLQQHLVGKSHANAVGTETQM